MKTDLQIAQQASLQPIYKVAARYGIQKEFLIPYGAYMAKLDIDREESFGRFLKSLPRKKRSGHYIDVTAITPTPLGEGKTVTTIGLTQGLCKIGKRAVVAIRQPSMGPTFGIKGGAAGGGYSQIVPMEDFNLHLTGDNHSVGIATNLLAAAIDNHIFHGNELDIEVETITWKRVVDLNDRPLREVVIGGGTNGAKRKTGFDILVASEVMAILALASDLSDLRLRLGRIVVAYNSKGRPVTAEQLGCAGAMCALMKEAIKPNIMQTLEGGLAFVHAGPFANIAHGNSSIIADRAALAVGDYVVTESGFGSDIGMEKFMDIKCRYSGLRPSAVCMVATVKGLKAQSGDFSILPGRPIPSELFRPDVKCLQRGLANLKRHIENVKAFNVPLLISINKFATDSLAEIKELKRAALEYGADAVEVSTAHKDGGAGATGIAREIVKLCEGKSGVRRFTFLYDLDKPIKEKIETIAIGYYKAKRVKYSKKAEDQIRRYAKNGFGDLPIAMAKTHLSLSDNPAVKGAPEGFTLTVREVRASIGAGFLYVICGPVMTMPGLPRVPAATNVDVDIKTGRVRGLF